MERLGSLAREREVHLGQPGLKFVFSRGQAWLKFCPLRRHPEAAHSQDSLTLLEALGMRLLGFWTSPVARGCCPVP